MAEPAPLHRSAEVEDLTHITEEDKKKMKEHIEKGTSSLHRSKEMEDLAHLSPQDINKPLINDNKQH
jgi:hypothetical protein